MQSGLIKSKFFIAVGLIALVMMGVFASRGFYKKKQIQREISSLQEEIGKLETKNEEVLDLINYFKTQEYKERQARSLLNLQKPGEFAVALPPQEEEEPEAGPQSIRESGISNLQKWWEYFFENDK